MDDKTLKALEILASKLGTTSDFLWAVLVKQAVLSALSGLVGVALSIFFLGLIVVAIRKGSEKEQKELEAMLGFIYCAAFLIFVFCVPGHISTLINPEYWALNRIFEAVGN